MDEVDDKLLLVAFHNGINSDIFIHKLYDKLLLAAFHNGINSDIFIHKLYEKEPQSMAELVHSA